MKKSRVYTKTGDTGETGLVSGHRVLKSDQRIDLYGEVDELNSRVGYAVALFPPTLLAELKVVARIQSALFDLGSNLACEPALREKYRLPQLDPSLIQELEKEMDRMEESLEPLKNFILPGGVPASASLHLCRTGARNVERRLVSFREQTQEVLPAHSLIFLNRLSDYFFVLARFVNKHEHGTEQLWAPQN